MASKTRGRVGVRIASSGAVPAAGPGASGPVDGRGMAAPGSRQEAGASWPAWARVAVSVALVYHLVAVVAGAMRMPPSSDLERAIADGFLPYYDAMDLGHSYRFYQDPGPTPVVTATIRYEDGRLEETVRLPGRDVAGPRMRHQRQLALANALNEEVQGIRRQGGDVGQSRLAWSYASHIRRTHPGCRSVTLYLQQHLFPDAEQMRRELESSRAARVDLFDERFFTTPEWIGDFP
jgi:hypothetical protein